MEIKQFSYEEYLRILETIKTEGKLNWLNDRSGFELPSKELTEHIKSRVSCCMMAAEQCDDTVKFDLGGTLEWITEQVEYYRKTGEIKRQKPSL